MRCFCCTPQEETACEDVSIKRSDEQYRPGSDGHEYASPHAARLQRGRPEDAEERGEAGPKPVEGAYAALSDVSLAGRYKASDLEERPRGELEDGSFYAGQWLGQRRCGEGKIERRGIGTYEGQFVDDKATGRGRFVKLNGDVYEGQWQNDLAHGKGTYLHADGSSYEGQWTEDLKAGFGCETWLDGSTFEGEYVRGKKHGRGVYHSSDRSTYEGQFFLDMMDGEGQYLFADGRVYNGQWSQSRMSGKGHMVWPDGRHFEGEYEDDRRQGLGKFTWPDGRAYHGQWLRGKQHGRGTYTSPEGRSWTGEWAGGQKVKPNTKAGGDRGGGYNDTLLDPRRNKNDLDFGQAVRERPTPSNMSNRSELSDRTVDTNMSRSGPAVPPVSRISGAHVKGSESERGGSQRRGSGSRPR